MLSTHPLPDVILEDPFLDLMERINRDGFVQAEVVPSKREESVLDFGSKQEE